MKFKRNLTNTAILHPIVYVPLLNTFVVLFFFVYLSPYLVFPSAVHLALPKAVTSDIIPEQITTILITGEDVIYYNNQIMTNRELKKSLTQTAKKNQPLLIKADGRSSLARIVEVWNICRELGLERVNLATTKIK